MSTGSSSPPRSASWPASPGTTIGQWARWGYIRSSASDGEPRVYGIEDIGEATIVAELLARGVSHADVRRAIDRLGDQYGEWPLSEAPLGTATDPRPLLRRAARARRLLRAARPRLAADGDAAARGGGPAAAQPPPSRLKRRAARPTGEASSASPAAPTRGGDAMARAAERPLLGGRDRVRRLAAELDRRRARLLLDGAHALLPAGVERGERLVAARGRDAVQVAEQRRDVLRVEHRAACGLVALEQQVAGAVAQPRRAAAGAVRRGEGLQPARLRLGLELREQLARVGGAAAQDRARPALEAAGELVPVAGEVAGGGVELAQSPMLGPVEPVSGAPHGKVIPEPGAGRACAAAGNGKHARPCPSTTRSPAA